jgi:hypothetical protein
MRTNIGSVVEEKSKCQTKSLSYNLVNAYCCWSISKQMAGGE